MANECIEYYAPGRNVTALASAAITGCRFLKISGNRTGTTGGVSDGLVPVATADAGGRAFGVSQRDAASGENVGVVRGNSRVVPVQAGASTIAAFAEVEVGAAGVAVTKASGVAVGFVITGAAANGIAQVSLY